MKRKPFTHALILLTAVVIPFFSVAQTVYTKQVITANGGMFEFAPPYTDFASVQAYNPVNGQVNQVGPINTQSVQDVLITGEVIFVTAQDSLIKYHASTYERLAAIADSGLNKLCLCNGKLVVTKQFPLSTYFVEILDTSDLSLVARVEGIPGDCGGAAAAGDTLYVAVNGGWMGTEGKIAVIETSAWTLHRIINLGPEAIGVFNLYHYNNKLFSVNKSPYATPTVGSISAYDLQNHTIVNTILNVNVGNGAAVHEGLLYLGLNYGLGTFNLGSLQIEDTVVVADPGSAFFRYILSATVDTLNDRVYANIGDYVMNGTCLVTTLEGDSLTSYPTGISSDALAIEYRTAPAGKGDLTAESLHYKVYPNPATDFILLENISGEPLSSVAIMDPAGRILFNTTLKAEPGVTTRLDLSRIPAGLYLLQMNYHSGSQVSRLIIQ